MTTYGASIRPLQRSCQYKVYRDKAGPYRCVWCDSNWLVEDWLWREGLCCAIQMVPVDLTVEAVFGRQR